MSGVLHPVGPEPEETYWLRRAMVAGAVLVLVILVVALLVNSSSTGSAQATAPTPSPSQPAAPASETPSAFPSTTSASPTASPGEPASPSASASPSTSESTSALASPSASTSADPTTKPSGKASSKATRRPAKKAAPAAPRSCSPAKLRATLTGDQRLKPTEKTTFGLSLINGSAETCRLSVTPENFELTIHSGTDRIWSSDHCDTAVKSIAKKVAAEDAVTWSMTWNGRRSAAGCKNRPEIPRAGTYVATAKLEGADPVQLRMILRD